MAISVKVSGLDDLRKKLEKLSGDEQTTIMQQAFEKGANVILNTAIQLCPVATGELRNSITTKTSKRKGNVSVRVGILGGGHKYKGQFFYASFQEYGHYAGKRNALSKVTDSKKQGRGGRKWIDGRHFLRQAAQAHKTDVPTQIVTGIAAGIERLGGT